ncbi:translesion error-prone DNA polymerase V autoproteolytic subunit [Sphingomonas cynarae]
MTRSGRPRLSIVSSRRAVPALTLHDVPFELVPREVPFFLCDTPAGFPSPAQDDMQEPIDLGAWLVEHPAASYIMRVDGRSMSGVGINDGDLIVVNRAKEPRAGMIVVALVHGDRTLKRLRYVDGRHWLVPEAEGFTDILVDEHVQIWGVVVGVARKMA